MRPSIIFFDEIDGLAPVRSSRQDQIHSSIVSTLLGLMDGLDNRGEIIIIGMCNEISNFVFGFNEFVTRLLTSSSHSVSEEAGFLFGIAPYCDMTYTLNEKITFE